MDTVSLVGIDLGKRCFHLHAQDASGRMVFRKKLTRSQMFALLGNFPSCTVVMEACAGAHWIARRLQALAHNDNAARHQRRANQSFPLANRAIGSSAVPVRALTGADRVDARSTCTASDSAARA